MNPNSESIYLTPFQRHLLEDNLQKELPNSFRQRLEIILLTDRGKSQADICRILGCCTATASRWIQLTKVGLAHKYLDCPVGRPKVVTDEYIELLQELLQHSPKNYGYPFKSWTVNWLGKHIAKETGVTVSESHLKRVMGELGLSTRAKARLETCVQSHSKIHIADLRSNVDRVDNELAELNLAHIKLDARIYGSQSSSSACFAAAAQRNLRYFTHSSRISSWC